MFIFLETETTGTGPEDSLCQIAFKPKNGKPVHELINPGRPISIDAMAVHHITNKMLQNKPPFSGSELYDQLSDLVALKASCNPPPGLKPVYTRFETA